MIKLLLTMLLILYYSVTYAGPVVNWGGGGVAEIYAQNGLEFFDNTRILTGADDPTITAQEAQAGSLYISTSTTLTYQKQDAGLSTNWSPLYFVPSFTDDNRLVRTNGTDDVQQSGIVVDDTDNITGVLDFEAVSAKLTGLTEDALIVPALDGSLESTGVLIDALDAVSGMTQLDVDNVRLDGNTISSTDLNGNVILDPNGAGNVNFPDLTASRVPYIDASNSLIVSDITPTELGYLDGVTSDIQPQLDAKIDDITSTTDNAIVRTDGTTGEALQDSGVLIDDVDAVTGITQLDVDNVRIDGNTVSTSDVDGDLILDPNGGGNVQAPKLLFDGIAEPAHQEGLLFYDSDIDSLSYYNAESEVTMNIGEENWVQVRNNTGSTITDGSVVYVSGATGLRPEVTLAQANAFATSKVIGLATHDIETSSNGYVTTQGIVRGLDTTAFTNGDLLYLSPTVAGGLTTTAPTKPDISILVGRVVNAHATQGKILVNTNSFPSTGFTEGAIAFGDSESLLVEDPTNLNWDDTLNILTASDLTLSNVTANRALTTGASSEVVASAVTDTELGYLTGAESNIQTQIDEAPKTWTASTSYAADERVIHEDSNVYKLYTSKASFTSGLTFDPANWNEVSQSRADIAELLNDGSFEYGVTGVSCTNATVSATSTAVHGRRAARIDVTADGGGCTITSTVSGDKADKPYLVQAAIRSTSSNVQLEFLDDTTSKNLIFSEAENNFDANGEYQTLSTQIIPQTSIVTEVTGNNTDVIYWDFNKHELGGLPTLESYFQKTVELDATGSGDFTGGTLRVSRVGDVVTLHPSADLTHASLSDVSSAAGFLPVWATPDTTASNAYVVGSTSLTVYANTDGSLSLTYRNSSGVADTRTNTLTNLSLSYNLNDEYSGPTSFAAAGSRDFKTETKVQSSNISSETDSVSSLVFDLVVGQKYQVSFGGNVNSSTANANIYVYEGATQATGNDLLVFENQTGNPVPAYGTKIFTATESNLRVRVDAAVTLEAPAFLQLTTVPDTANIVAELKDTLKYDGAGPMIGGYASFGSSSGDGTVCNASPCAKYREEGSDGVSFGNPVRLSEGVYDVTASGFKANANVTCYAYGSNSGNGRLTDMSSDDLVSDGSGDVAFRARTWEPSGTSGATISQADTYFHASCFGQRP